MISWVVASHEPATLAANLQPALDHAASLGDEAIVVRDAPSIATAYNLGRAEAAHALVAYVHHDVRILDVDRVRAELVRACTDQVGMVGVIGSRAPVWPWWESPARCGSVYDSRMGRLDYGMGGQAAAVVDGLLMATAQPHTWDETYPGWHGYDHDMCLQMLDRSLPNWVIPFGADLVEHHTGGSADVTQLDGWAAAAARWREKWT